MNFIPRRYDGDGVPLGLFERYQGIHRRPSSAENAARACGRFATQRGADVVVLAIAGLVFNGAFGQTANAQQEPQALGTEASALMAAEGLLDRLAEGHRIGYLPQALMSADGLCVRLPVVMEDPGGRLFWGELRRMVLDDPSTAMAVVMGEIKPGGHTPIYHDELRWDAERMAYVTKTGSAPVGEVLSGEPGQNCADINDGMKRGL